MKFPATYETEVYTNDNGHLVIKQLQDRDEVFVVVPRTYAKLLAKEIRRLDQEGSLSDLPYFEGLGD